MKGISIFFSLALIAFLSFSTIGGAQPVYCGTYDAGCTNTNGCYCDDGGVYLFGGGYDNRRDAHHYSHRGSASRQAAHSGGGRKGRR